MASVEGGGGWGRPSVAPSEAPPVGPPGMPRFEQPTWIAPPPGPEQSMQPAWVSEGGSPRRSGGGWITRGWAWTALVLLALIPVGLTAAIVYTFTATADAADRDPDGMEGEWIPLLAFVAFAAWAVACTVGAMLAAIIGTVRARRHPEITRAPVISVLVWVGLGVIVVPFALSIATSIVTSFL